VAKKTMVPLCSRCDTPHRSKNSFCSTCGFPTPWATHEEQIAWEVRQWRASRARSEPDKPQMMLVRTDNGFEPMEVRRHETYVWDQPLHPDRETNGGAVAQAPAPAPAPRAQAPAQPAPRAVQAPAAPVVQTPVPASVESAIAAVATSTVTPPAPAPAPPRTNGNGYTYVVHRQPATREPPPDVAVSQPVEARPAEPVDPPVIEDVVTPPDLDLSSEPIVAPEDEMSFVDEPSVADDPSSVDDLGSVDDLSSVDEPSSVAVESVAAPAEASAEHASSDRVSVSFKAIAIGVALVVALPLGAKLLDAGRDAPRAPRPATAAANGIRTLALVNARAGFHQLGPDSARYGVVIRNPNRSLAATGVTLTVWLKDSGGRLVGTDTVRIPFVAAGKSLGVAEAMGVSGAASRMSVSITTDGFAPLQSGAFTIRGINVARPAADRIVVKATVSGVEAVSGARLVVIHLDRSGRVVGGDFTILDIPEGPAVANAVIATANVDRSIARVELYVVPSA